MNSHALTNKYLPVPASLRYRLVGDDHPASNFRTTNPLSLKDYREALVIADGQEPREFGVPITYFRDHGIAVKVITQDWLFDWKQYTPGMVMLE